MAVERAVPAIEGGLRHIYLKSVSRYCFAARYAKRATVVVDAACGVGFGATLLAAQGCSVIAIDIDAGSCAKTKTMCMGQECCVINGDCRMLPLASDVADLFISFETIEHIAEQAAFVCDVCRVLKPQGMFIVSTPNLDVVDQGSGSSGNPFHLRELSLQQFSELLRSHFGSIEMYGQVANPVLASLPQLQARVQELEAVVDSQRRLLWRVGIARSLRDRAVSLVSGRRPDNTPAPLHPLQEGPRLTAEAVTCAPVGLAAPAVSDNIVAVCTNPLRCPDTAACVSREVHRPRPRPDL